MSLRDQPYLPLYVQDFLTDEKLAQCSAESAGVYIYLLCLMHKSHDYGKILLRQKEQQKERQVSNFAVKLARQMPYDVATIERALDELIDEKVLYTDDNALCQKRMIRDAELSEKRSYAGKKGAESSNKRFKTNADFASAKRTAKVSANTENEDEDEIEYEIESNNSLGKVMSYYMDHINTLPSSLTIGLLEDYTNELGADVTIHAIQIAMDEQKRSWSYINAILKRYKADGLNTMDKVLQSEQRYQEGKKNKPDGNGRKRAKAPGEYKGDDFIAYMNEGGYQDAEGK